MIDIARLIREKRAEKNLSQDEVAKRANLTTITYGRIERGLVPPKLEQVEKIADALSIDIRDLFDGNQKSEPSAIRLINNIISDAEKLRKLMGYK